MKQKNKQDVSLAALRPTHFELNSYITNLLSILLEASISQYTKK